MQDELFKSSVGGLNKGRGYVSVNVELDPGRDFFVCKPGYLRVWWSSPIVQGYLVISKLLYLSEESFLHWALHCAYVHATCANS